MPDGADVGLQRTHEEVERARAEAAAAMRADGVELDAATLERLRADAPPPAGPIDSLHPLTDTGTLTRAGQTPC